ncbi:MAG TPA: hypothetical protein VFQ44_14060 [Streptosporangiaceae bacterium]|nr:hypothetical protein [Streptosporangiaceae bacterium]
MTPGPGPGTSWPAALDLNYLDDEQVSLDVAAIIAEGARIRSKRFLTRMAVVALICGVGSAAFTLSQIELLAGQPGTSAGNSHVSGTQRTIGAGTSSHSPDQVPSDSGTGYGIDPVVVGKVGLPKAGPNSSLNPGPVGGTAPRGSGKPPPEYNLPGHYGSPGAHNLQPVQLVPRFTVKLAARFGPLRALVGAPSGGGAWYLGTRHQVVLFHLSLDGSVTSWPVLTAGDLSGSEAARMPVSLAVTRSGIAWLGVNTRLVRVNTRTGMVSSFAIPPPRMVQPSDYDPRSRRHLGVQSVAVSPAGYVAVALSRSSGVQVLSPRTNEFHEIRMPARSDETESVGYSRDGTLGVGYISLIGAHRSGVLLSAPTGPILTATVTDARAVLPYRASWLLVGIGHPDVVTATAGVQALRLPASTLDVTRSVLPLVSLPDDRLATAVGLEILSFPAYAQSVTAATESSDLYDTTPQRCPPPRPELTAFAQAGPPGFAQAEPPGIAQGKPPGKLLSPQPGDCPQGYQMVATDQFGDLWVVPTGGKRTIELLTVR